MKRKSVGVNAVLNTIQTIVSMIVPLVTFPYVSRVLGVEALGRYNFSQSVVSYFVLMAGLGINTYAVREGAGLRNDKARINAFVENVFSINVYSTVLALLLLLGVMSGVTKLREYSDIIFVLASQIVFTTIGRGWIYTIYEDYMYITIRTVLFQLFSAGLLFIFVRDSDDVLIYALISIMGIIGNNIANLICSKKYCKFSFRYNPELSYFKSILILFCTSLSVTIYTSSDTIILGFLGTDYSVGLYSTSIKIYNIVKQMVAAILTVSIPRCSYYIGCGKVEEYQNLFNKIFNTLIFFLLPATFGLLSLSKECIYLIAGQEYLEASFSLQILSVAIVFNLMSYMLGYCVLIPHKEEGLFLKATMISAAANIALNFILIPYYMQNAAALTTVIAECITMMICYFGAKKYIHNLYVGNNLICVLCGSLSIGVVCFIIKKLVQNTIVIIVLSVTISAIVFGGIQILLKNTFLKEIFRILKRK